jgi:hypothetical protein
MNYNTSIVLASNGLLYTTIRNTEGEIVDILEGEVDDLAVTDHTADFLPAMMILDRWCVTSTLPRRYDFLFEHAPVVTLEILPDGTPVDHWLVEEDAFDFETKAELFRAMAQIVKERHA